MHSKSTTPATHRLQRYHRWAMLWLGWFVGFLDAAGALAPQARAIGHAWLDQIERLIVSLVIIRAAPSVRINPIKHAQRRRNDAQVHRALMGGALRRALRSKDLRQRIAALSQAMDVLVARFLKRLPRGLTRRRPILPKREMRVALCVAPGVALCAADTS